MPSIFQLLYSTVHSKSLGILSFPSGKWSWYEGSPKKFNLVITMPTWEGVSYPQKIEVRQDANGFPMFTSNPGLRSLTIYKKRNRRCINPFVFGIKSIPPASDKRCGLKSSPSWGFGSLSHTISKSTWKWMVGRWDFLFFWEGLFSGIFAVSFRY